MRTPPFLRTERLVVRLAELRDVPLVLRYFEENGHRYEPPRPGHLLSAAHWEEKVLEASASFLAGTACKVFLFDPTEGEVLGTASLFEVRRAPLDIAQLGYVVGASIEGRGLACEGVGALVDYGFDVLGLHRLEATYDPSNARSAALLARLGFRVEGTLRRQRLVRDVWQDQTLAALLSDERRRGPGLT